jgi:flagellar L-ring protein precursor FlgH
MRPGTAKLHCAVRGWLLAVGALWGLAAWPVAAGAQSNSLFNGRSKPAPASQPAAVQPATAWHGTVPAALPTMQNDRLITRPNATLLRVSPLAVAPPEPEKIGVNSWITVVVLESKTATSGSQLESKKDWTFDTQLKQWVRLSDEHGVVPAKFEAGNPAAAWNLQNDYKGDGKYDRKDSLTTRIEARVVDVKPNGSLVLEARKQINGDDDGYTMILTGECRSQDVTAQNTILSTQVGELKIDVQHHGAVRDAARRGWAQKALDFLRPF